LRFLANKSLARSIHAYDRTVHTDTIMAAIQCEINPMAFA